MYLTHSISERYLCLQAAFEVHLRALLRLLDQTAVPRQPTAQELRAFGLRFQNIGAAVTTINGHLKHYAVNINNSAREVEELHRLCNSSRGNIAKNILRISEEHLLLMFAAVASVGLVRWNPDILGNHESVYNMAHEHIALITFRRMLSQLGYAFMGTGGAKANDIALLTSLYRNFMFSYLHGLVQKEGREPGRVAGDSEKKLAYARRTRVSTIYHLIPTVLTIT